MTVHHNSYMVAVLGKYKVINALFTEHSHQYILQYLTIYQTFSTIATMTLQCSSTSVGSSVSWSSLYEVLRISF